MYRCEIKIWSKVGHTPITKRSGSYCDVLHKQTIEVRDVSQAHRFTKHLLKEIKFADSGHYFMPEFPNQNTRSNFVR